MFDEVKNTPSNSVPETYLSIIIMWLFFILSLFIKLGLVEFL